MSDRAEHKPARTQVWIVAAIFLVPLALAFFLYYGSGGWRPAGTTNRGELIQPVRPLPEVELLTPSGEAFAASNWRGKWTLLYVGDGRCDTRCREALTLMRQTRLALNQDMNRVQRVFLATANCCEQSYLDAEHAGLLIARLDVPQAAPLSELLAQTGVGGGAGMIYVVDPLGNLMMRHAPGVPPKGLLEDLKKLLKLSHIG